MDLLLVHAPFPGETDPRRQADGLGNATAGYATEFMALPLTGRQVTKWRGQADQLHDLVRGWTGNPLQVLEMSSFEWADHRRRGSTLFEDISRDAVEVAEGPSWMTVGRTESRPS